MKQNNREGQPIYTAGKLQKRDVFSLAGLLGCLLWKRYSVIGAQ